MKPDSIHSYVRFMKELLFDKVDILPENYHVPDGTLSKEEIEMAVPLSPGQILEKRYGVFKHPSQKDGVVFQGTDMREFWQRAEERNRETAETYHKIGLATYVVIEAFVKWEF